MHNSTIQCSQAFCMHETHLGSWTGCLSLVVSDSGESGFGISLAYQEYSDMCTSALFSRLWKNTVMAHERMDKGGHCQWGITYMPVHDNSREPVLTSDAHADIEGN